VGHGWLSLHRHIVAVRRLDLRGLGGASSYFTQPWYQRGVVPSSPAETLPGGTAVSCPMRVTPDVAMDADPFTGFLVGMTQTLPNGSLGYAEGPVGGALTGLVTPAGECA
jgi:hypothetical protein